MTHYARLILPGDANHHGTLYAGSLLRLALATLKEALSDHSATSALDEAAHAQQALLPAMDAVRTAADALETVVADDLWPLPTYQEMLFIK